MGVVVTDLPSEIAQEAPKRFTGLSLWPRVVIAVLAFLIVLALLFALKTSSIDWFGLTKKRADTAEVKAKASDQSANLATNTVHIIEKYTTTERVVTQRAEDQAHAVQAIPSDDLPAAVRDGWFNGLHDIDASALDHHRSTNAP